MKQIQVNDYFENIQPFFVSFSPKKSPLIFIPPSS